MSSGNRGGWEGRGRISTGRRRRRLEGPWLKVMRQVIKELMGDGYSAEDIVRYLLTEELGPPSRPEPCPEDRPEPPQAQMLQVKNVELQVKTNTEAHHTEEFDILESCQQPALVVRRGQPFTIQVQFSQAYPQKNYNLRLVFEIGSSPTESKGTRAAFLVSDKDREGKWDARLVKKTGQTVQVDVSTPANCIVGKWRFGLEVVKKGERKPVSRYDQEKPIYILFNPWCPEDVVYYEHTKDLEEYVLDELGCIFVGTSYRSRARPWEFGQFSGNVLDCCFYLLDSSDLNMRVRGDPVKVVRKLSAMINACDEGVLKGNWSGEYDDGIKPSEWSGSSAILEQFYETKAPVKYGQCWVFSGVLTTVCRALGIPCRSVTNFDSAHDTDCSVTIDVHVDVNGKPMDLHSDSIWNFHVWNEAWMRRDDLPKGYGGWQAVDATPQECSEGVYQCGPCPLLAIKKGDLNMAYDAPFIFAEVNADKVFWKWSVDDAEFKPLQYNKRAVGHNISTRALKSVRGNDAAGRDPEREVVTHLYKYPEGSDEERAAVLKAYRVVTDESTHAYDTGPQDVDFKLEFCAESPVGQDFVVKLVCQNNSCQERTVGGQGTISTMYYTGIVVEELTKSKYSDIKLAAGASHSVEVKVSAKEYLSKAKDNFFMSFTLVAMVQETQQSVIKTDTAMLAKPDLSIKASDKVKVGEEFQVTVTFSNPLPCTLTKCQLKVEGPGIRLAQEVPGQGDVPAQGTFMSKLKLTARKKGQRHVVFVFSSQQLDNITATHSMHVQA